MSRNFELMQNLGKERDILQGSAPAEIPASARMAAAVAPAPEAMLPAEIAPPQLAMSGAQADEIVKVVQRVFLASGLEGSRMVVLAAAEPGAGCSWISARVAEVLATQVSGTVCAVDANLRSPGLRREFGMPEERGITEALQSSESIRAFVAPTGRPNLFVLGSGAAAADAQTLLGSDRMRWRLGELRKEFDYVVLDAPPLSAGNDSVALARSAEGVVLVLKAHSSRRESARKAVQDLETANVRVLGAVLNQRTFPIPESIYRKL